MIKLSKATEIPRSSIRKMFDIASTMDNVISFAVGEPDFITPRNIIDAAKKALDAGETHYTPNAGILPLRKAVSKKLKEYNGIDYDPETEIIITTGGMEALMLSMITAFNQGDEIILTDPCWTNYPNQVLICGAVPKFVQVFEEDSFIYNPDKLAKAITPKTKAIIINSPANPTGGVASREVLEDIAKIAIKYDLLVFSDEVYRRFVYDDVKFSSITSIKSMKERTILIDSFSKSYAMTGWRVGFTAGPKEIISNMTKLQENVCACVNSATQFAALEALEGPQDSLNNMIEKYAERRKLIYDGINSIENLSCKKPKGAFYAFINITKTGLTSEEFAMRLLKEARVVVVPGTGFGKHGEGFVRISYATSNQNIEEGIKRINNFVKSL
ncbi:pyridoxal phosphate-dependent aminotransferase [Clostridium sp. MT-14]|uniref:Aminotransferase n=1 Tax=Clostridium aromativorans TaxID=2836848 RepID=A0ABS8N762_9CLOT|nr:MULTISPECIES: pyridoxal phosphate-dependent aminotransferase [Clostridium]KAA8674703.1 pyridoxal phosphate-dependent aminotransferase [Clostridium sp. HV4-5-A1G]MCC9295656.1 pyridoxal phosphate-dependent aminotransferase [Clostridium aromativorans]CAB1249969.1 Aspartate aminotransferase [Clostridiaceae bacterium BL-3]